MVTYGDFYFPSLIAGITEHFGINVVDCDMIMGSLEHALSSTGGFCAGRSFVIHHQRLCGLGYCFSASLPPLLAVAASKGLEIIKNDQERLTRLHENSKMTNLGLQEALKHTGFKVSGDLLSPLQHIFYDGNAAEETLDNLVEKMRRKGYLLARARYLSEEFFASKPSIRISVQSEMTTDELYAFLTMLKKEARKVDKKASL
ncbi:unnamed protein product [Thelazia callipaeda]|uniref:Serine palmitoyltransferase 1 n=1 Tax=Thelazia callipaeda TaxID=103827 RepID=A0A0N5CMU3_THECL|nr:unnamed protein product [Thelazia callipaeda]